MYIKQKSIVGVLSLLGAVMILGGCSSPPPASPPPLPAKPSVQSLKSSTTTMPTLAPNSLTPNQARPTPVGVDKAKPVWIAASWNDLPGWSSESMSDVWAALLHGCERPTNVFMRLCTQLRPLSIADEAEQRLFLMTNLQPYKVLNASGDSSGLLTGYFEPVFNASRIKKVGFEFPLYAPTAEILNVKASHSKWFSRQEIETSPLAQEALKVRRLLGWQTP